MFAVGVLTDDPETSRAVTMVMDQGIKVIGLRFISPFGRCEAEGGSSASELADRLGIRLVPVPHCHDYLDVIREPQFGRGAGMNPCIDCRIYQLKKAKAIADEMGAKFIFTGESLSLKQASRQIDTLGLIEREAGMEGEVLRPLSASLLPETEAERSGWIDRHALIVAAERGRRKGPRPPKAERVSDDRCHARGCLLADPDFSARLEDFLAHSDGTLSFKDVRLLKLGRHFRVDGHKTVVGRDRGENLRLLSMTDEDVIVLSPVSVPGPVGLLDGNGVEVLETVASIVARYSDGRGKKVQLKVSSRYGGGTLEADPMPLTLLKDYLIDGRASERGRPEQHWVGTDR